MAKRRKIAQTVLDPTLPKVPIEIDGKQYFLSFDLGALAEAKWHFAKQGHTVNLLQALTALDIDNLMVIFPCAVHKHHPELSFEDAQRLLSIPVLYAVAAATAAAWRESMPKPAEKGGEPAHPPKP